MTEPVTIATINLCNIGEWSAQEKVDNLLYSIEHDLLFPKIIAVQEIGGIAHFDNEPVIAPLAMEICMALNQKAPFPYQYIDVPPYPEANGGAISCNIRCGFFYQHHPELELKEYFSIGTDIACFTGDTALNFSASRPPLLACFSYYSEIFWVVNCHLKSNSKRNQTRQTLRQQKHLQVQYLLTYLQTHIPNNTAIIIAGDLNDTPGSRTLSLFSLAGFHSAHHKMSSGLYSYKHHKKPVLIDYIMYNSKILLDTIEICHNNTMQGSYKFSDHDPVLTSFYL